MATYGTAKTEYAPGATYGSVAYDLGRVRRPAEYEIPFEAPEARPVERRETAVYAEPKRHSVSLFAVAGFFAAAVMIVFMLLATVRLTETTARTMELRTQLTQLQASEHELAIQYRSAFNMEKIEDYAVGTLGMVKLSDGQTIYLDSARQDKAVVLGDAETEPASAKGLVSFITSLLAYL